MKIVTFLFVVVAAIFSNHCCCAAEDGFLEVNALRVKCGLRPFLYDQGLEDAAGVCADFRAAHGIGGHTSNDFAALAPGVRATAAGCGDWYPGQGWGTCCTVCTGENPNSYERREYEKYTYAGAAWTIGRDGKRYMHIFVR